jgi:hypothetical protein
MLQGSPAEITSDPSKAALDKDGKPVKQTDGYYYTQPENAKQYMKEYSWYNHAGAGMVGFWMTLLFMVMLGFMYSYFWTASSMIYLLMRKKVDEVEVDEIYTEEEVIEEPVSPPKLSTAAPSGAATIPVDAPTLRVQPGPAPTPPPAPEAPPTPPSDQTPPAAPHGSV